MFDQDSERADRNGFKNECSTVSTACYHESDCFSSIDPFHVCLNLSAETKAKNLASLLRRPTGEYKVDLYGV